MKVLINALGVDMGGALRHLRSFLPALDRAGAGDEFVVVVRKSVADTLSLNRITIHAVASRVVESLPSRLFQELVRLPLFARRQKADVVVSLTNFGPIWSAVPHILFQRNALYFRREVWDRFDRGASRKLAIQRALVISMIKSADLVVTPSRSMADMVRAAVPGLAAQRIETLHHAFDDETIAGSLEAPIRKAVESSAGLRILYASHPGPHKDFETLFEILSLARRDGLSFTLFLTIARADSPSLFDSYQRTIARLNLTSSVVFLGRVLPDQMSDVYRSADVMIYPSLCESFGFSMVEAMSCGLPIVAAGTAVNREMGGDAALYYDPGDAPSGWRTLSRALDSNVRARLGDNARARIKNFPGNWKTYAERFIELVEAVGR